MDWKQEYDIGILEIDDQHKELFKMVNNIKTSILKGVNSEQIIKTVFTNIVEYTQKHFASEEVLMKKMHFPGVDIQKRQHQQLITDIVTKLKGMKTGTKQNPTIMYNFLNQWLLNHIVSEDQKLRDFVYKRRQSGVEI